jgi:hypothetical protein
MISGITVSGDAAVITGDRAETNGFFGGSDLKGFGIYATGYTPRRSARTSSGATTTRVGASPLRSAEHLTTRRRGAANARPLRLVGGFPHPRRRPATWPRRPLSTNLRDLNDRRSRTCSLN